MNDHAPKISGYRPSSIGTRVSYEDQANPRREGAIVGEIAGQWAIRWDENDGVYRMIESHGLFFHTTVPKGMLDRAQQRQIENPDRRVAGWNVVAHDVVTCDRCKAAPATTHQEYRAVGDDPSWSNRTTDRCDRCAQDLRDYAAADDPTEIVVDEPLQSATGMSSADRDAIADALETFASIDEGEYTDTDELRRLAALVRSGS